MKIREEFSFLSIEDHLKKDITAIIVGSGTQEDRSKKIANEFRNANVQVVCIDYNYDTQKYSVSLLNDPYSFSASPSHSNLPGSLMRALQGHTKSILIDITSLQHPVIIVLLNILRNTIKPAHLFASYVKPEQYLTRDNLGKYNFSAQVYEPAGIPGLIRQRKDHEIIIPFLGFEGDRLQNIVENMSYQVIIPIIGFPSENPSWQFESLRNCMQVLESTYPDAEIRKCKANSIYDAIYVLNEIEELYPDGNFVLLPLGIRTHTAACGIWAAKRKNVRILYDYATETTQRSTGIGETIVYHLSRFL